jgi:four helix bundle protein
MEKEKFKNHSRQSSKRDIQERAYKFSLSIIHLVDSLSNNGSDRIISNQVMRSATSVGANIVEAQAGSSRRDFKNFLNHALKSANETKYWLALIKDSDKKPKADIDPLLQEASELANILAASIITLKGS